RLGRARADGRFQCRAAGRVRYLPELQADARAAGGQERSDGLSPGPARAVVGQEHARSGGLSGEGEMTRATTMLVSGFVSAAVLAGAAQTGLDPAKLLKPGTDAWP